MSPEAWSELQPHARDSLIANEASTRRACQAADVADAAAAKSPKDAALDDTVFSYFFVVAFIFQPDS